MYGKKGLTDGWNTTYTVMTTAMLEMYVPQIARKVQAKNACNLNLNLLHLIRWFIVTV